MRTRDDERHTGEATGDETPQEREPAGIVFGRDHIDTEDFAMPIRVDFDREHGREVDDPAARADFLGERGNPHVRVGPGVEWSVAELGDDLSGDSLVNDRRGRLPHPIASIMVDILSRATPLIAHVRQTGSSPGDLPSLDLADRRIAMSAFFGRLFHWPGSSIRHRRDRPIALVTDNGRPFRWFRFDAFITARPELPEVRTRIHSPC